MERLSSAIRCSRTAFAIESPAVEQSQSGSKTGSWLVTVFDNDFNTYQEVIAILMIATQCTLREAEIETWEIDHLGRSVVHQASQGECEKVSEIISTIGLHAEVSENT